MDNDKGYYNLVALVIYRCLTPISITASNYKKSKIINRRLKFVKGRTDGKMVKLFCGCQDYFNYQDIKNEIINYNKKQ